MVSSRDFPTLETERLTLRQFHFSDARRVHELASAQELAATTLLPHPYRMADAERWIMMQYEDYKKGFLVNFAIVKTEDDLLIGSIGLELNQNHNRAQIGYWVGVPYWNQGFCTEAAVAVVKFGFEGLMLHRIYAPHFRKNPASGQVLKKIGMRHEGTQRQHYLRFGTYEDTELYGLLREEYEDSNSG